MFENPLAWRNKSNIGWAHNEYNSRSKGEKESEREREKKGGTKL